MSRQGIYFADLSLHYCGGSVSVVFSHLSPSCLFFFFAGLISVPCSLLENNLCMLLNSKTENLFGSFFSYIEYVFPDMQLVTLQNESKLSLPLIIIKFKFCLVLTRSFFFLHPVYDFQISSILCEIGFSYCNIMIRKSNIFIFIFIIPTLLCTTNSFVYFILLQFYFRELAYVFLYTCLYYTQTD